MIGKIDAFYLILATAGTAIAAVNMLKDWGLKNIVFVAVLASQDGLDALIEAHPDIQIWTGAVDPTLTGTRYISPGLGDVGDRYFGS